MPEHPRADQGYAYGEPSDVIGGRVMNADRDALYVRTADGRTFVVALNGQSDPYVEYGRDSGYEPDDPQNPAYVEAVLDRADLDRKRAKGEP